MCKQNGASHETGGNVFEDCQNRTVCKLAWHFSGLKWMAAICFCFFFFFVGLWTCLNILEQQSKYTDTRGRKWRDVWRALFSSSTRVCIYVAPTCRNVDPSDLWKIQQSHKSGWQNSLQAPTAQHKDSFECNYHFLSCINVFLIWPVFLLRISKFLNMTCSIYGSPFVCVEGIELIGLPMHSSFCCEQGPATYLLICNVPLLCIYITQFREKITLISVPS